MVEKLEEIFIRWWQVIAIMATAVVTIAGFGVLWGTSMDQLKVLADGQSSMTSKLDVVSRELGDAKMAAIIAKGLAERSQMQMDDLARRFYDLQQKLINTRQMPDPTRFERP